MAVLLLKFIFFAISFALNLVSQVIFTGTAYLFVSLIQGFKVPGQATQVALEYVGGALRSCLEYIIELLWETLATLVSLSFDLLLDAITSSFSLTGAAIGALMEMPRTSLDRLLKDVPEIFEGLSEMVSNIVTDLWNNYKDAITYLIENA